MLDFICMDLAELWGTGHKRQIKNNDMYVSSGIQTSNYSQRKLAH